MNSELKRDSTKLIPEHETPLLQHEDLIKDKSHLVDSDPRAKH